MRVLVPGGSGFIGSYLADELLADHEVHAAGLREDVSSVESFYGRPVPYIHCDYSIESLEEIIERVKPDAVVNLAAKRPATKDKDISSYYRNLYISANMFEACFNKGVLNLVNISTRLVYSQFNSIPWRESEPPAPQNYYGLSKQWSEDAAAFYNRKGLRIKTLRLAQVIGFGERQGYVLQVYLDNVLKGLPLKVFGRCTGKRHYVYAKDAAGAVLSALRHPEVSGIFNIGMSETYGFDELAETINRVFGSRSEIIFDKEKEADENIYQMSIEKAGRELEWGPVHDLYSAYQDVKRALGQ